MAEMRGRTVARSSCSQSSSFRRQIVRSSEGGRLRMLYHTSFSYSVLFFSCSPTPCAALPFSSSAHHFRLVVVFRSSYSFHLSFCPPPVKAPPLPSLSTLGVRPPCLGFIDCSGSLILRRPNRHSHLTSFHISADLSILLLPILSPRQPFSFPPV